MYEAENSDSPYHCVYRFKKNHETGAAAVSYCSEVPNCIGIV